MTYAQATAKAIRLSKVNICTEGGKDFDTYTVYNELNDYGRLVYGVAKYIDYMTKRVYDCTNHLEDYWQGEEV